MEMMTTRTVRPSQSAVVWTLKHPNGVIEVLALLPSVSFATASLNSFATVILQGGRECRQKQQPHDELAYAAGVLDGGPLASVGRLSSSLAQTGHLCTNAGAQQRPPSLLRARG